MVNGYNFIINANHQGAPPPTTAWSRGQLLILETLLVLHALLYR